VTCELPVRGHSRLYVRTVVDRHGEKSSVGREHGRCREAAFDGDLVESVELLRIESPDRLVIARRRNQPPVERYRRTSQLLDECPPPAGRGVHDLIKTDDERRAGAGVPQRCLWQARDRLRDEWLGDQAPSARDGTSRA